MTDTVYVVYDCGCFSKINIFYLVVYHGKCGCGSNLYVDGLAEGVLNMGTYLVSHRLLADYLHSSLLNGYVSDMVAKNGSINQISLGLTPDPPKQEVPCPKASLNEYDSNLELSALRTLCSESRQLVTYIQSLSVAMHVNKKFQSFKGIWF